MNTIRDQVDAEASSEPERLEREIDQQRDIIGGIVSALENKLSPSEIVDRLMGASKGTGGEFARNLGNVVRAHPVPTLLASAGLVWLYASRNDTAPVHEPARSDGRGHASAGAGSASARHGSEHDGPGEEVRDQASHLREGISQHASHLREGASHRLGGAREGFSHLMEENPLVVGAIALGIGALLGAALPVTRKEDELMGETGDKLRSTASEAGQTVRETGREVVEAVREEDGDSAREITDGVRSAGESTAGQDYASRSWTSDGSAGASTTRGLSGTTQQDSGNSPRNSI